MNRNPATTWGELAVVSGILTVGSTIEFLTEKWAGELDVRPMLGIAILSAVVFAVALLVYLRKAKLWRGHVARAWPQLVLRIVQSTPEELAERMQQLGMDKANEETASALAVLVGGGYGYMKDGEVDVTYLPYLPRSADEGGFTPPPEQVWLPIVALVGSVLLAIFGCVLAALVGLGKVDADRASRILMPTIVCVGLAAFIMARLKKRRARMHEVEAIRIWTRAIARLESGRISTLKMVEHLSRAANAAPVDCLIEPLELLLDAPK